MGELLCFIEINLIENNVYCCIACRDPSLEEEENCKEKKKLKI
jgi:hypothetical protein